MTESCVWCLCVIQLESLWHNIGDCERPLDDADRKGNAAMQFEQVDGAEQHEVIMKVCNSYCAPITGLYIYKLLQ